MKKLFALMLVFSLLFLCSCKEEEKLTADRLFDYQKELRCVEGTVTEDGEAYSVKIYFKKSGEERVCRRIEFNAPESIKGLTFTLEGDKITAELDGIRMANTFFSPEDVFRFGKMFFLREEDVYSIKEGKNNTTVALGSGDGCTWSVITAKDGLPIEITYETPKGTQSMKIKSIEEFKEE